MDIYHILVVLIGFILMCDGQRRPRPRPRSRSRCFQRNLEYGRHFYQVIDEPVGKTTNVLKGSNKVYLGKPNRDATFTVIGPSVYHGSKGFVVHRICIFTKNVSGIRLEVTGLPRRQARGWVGGGQAYLRAKVKTGKKFVQTCLNPYKTPLSQLSIILRRYKRKGTRVQAQKLFIEACEKR